VGWVAGGVFRGWGVACRVRVCVCCGCLNVKSVVGGIVVGVLGEACGGSRCERWEQRVGHRFGWACFVVFLRASGCGGWCCPKTKGLHLRNTLRDTRKRENYDRLKARSTCWQKCPNT